MTQEGHVGGGKRTDPLLLLRELTLAKKKARIDDDYLEFDGGPSIHRSTKCGFRLKPDGHLMDIGSIWFMLHEISMGDRSYTTESSRSKGFQYIGVASRSDLMDYIVGRADTCEGLVAEVIEGRKRPKAGGAAGEYYHGKRAKVGDDGQPRKTKFSPDDISYGDVAARVRPVKDLDVLVRCPGRCVPNADLILRIAKEEWKNWNTQKVAAVPEPALGGKVPLHVELAEFLVKDKDAKPIILVPCNKNAPVNLLNVHEFLQAGDFKRADTERRRFFEATRPEVVEVTRNIGGKLWTFEVRDNASKFTKAQWLRTVAVVADGSDWQFKGWPFPNSVDLFTTIKGLYFQDKGLLVPVHVVKWQVEVLSLSAIHLGHRFAHVRDAFFEFIEEFMNSYRERKFVNTAGYEPEKRVIEKALQVL